MSNSTDPSADRQPVYPCRRCGHTLIVHYTEALALVFCAYCEKSHTDLAAECEIAALSDYP